MLNTIILMGRLVADPELRTTNSGVSVTSFRIAVDRNFTRQGEEKQTDFFDIVAWRSTAEFVARYMTRGSLIAVQGSMQSRKWQDKDGNNRISWEVQADNVYFAESRRDSSGSAPRYDSYAPAAKEEPSTYSSGSEGDFTPLPPDDDLPF